jgi:hypothetical protein
MKPHADRSSDAFYVGLLSAAIVQALRALERKDVVGAKVGLRQNLDDLLGSELLREDPAFRETLQRLCVPRNGNERALGRTSAESCAPSCDEVA